MYVTSYLKTYIFFVYFFIYLAQELCELPEQDLFGMWDRAGTQAPATFKCLSLDSLTLSRM